MNNIKIPSIIHRFNQLWQFKRGTCQITIVVKQPIVLIAFLISMILYVVKPVAVSAMVVTALGGLLVFAFGWSYTMAHHVYGKRVLHYAALQVGDELEELITLTNLSFLPVLWAEFEDHSDIPGYIVSGVNAVNAKQYIHWRAHAICKQRGVYSLGPWKLITGDPIGIFCVLQVYSDHKEVLIYPSLATLPADIIPENKKMGDEVVFNQPMAAETINATTTRPHVSGDSLRRVHWRTSARHDSLYVKTFQPEATSSVWLVPDFDQAVHFGEGELSTVETMVTLTASLASNLLEKRMAVGLLACTETIQYVLPRYGKPHLWQILRTLAPLQPSQTNRLTDTLQHAESLISSRDLLIVITPSTRIDWLEELKRCSGRRFRQNIQVLLLDPTSFEGIDTLEAVSYALADQGVPRKIITRQDIRPIQAAFGKLRRWEFSTWGTGKATLRERPREIDFGK